MARLLLSRSATPNCSLTPAQFLTFGSFALSYACCLIPAFGVVAAFTDPATGKPTEELEYAIGIFLIVWACLMVLFILASLRSSVAIVSCLVSRARGVRNLSPATLYYPLHVLAR